MSTHYGKATGGMFYPHNADDYFNDLMQREGKNVQVSITYPSRKRSIKQNALYQHYAAIFAEG